MSPVGALPHAGARPPGRDIIAIGASAGGLEAVVSLLKNLPADLPAAVFVVIHRGLREPNLLPELLSAAGPLPALAAHDGQHIVPGCVYLPPNDRHLLVAGEHIHVRRGPLENRARPAVDPLFRSAAVSCSSRVIGVVLSGSLDDGTSGLLAIKLCGGLAVVQDPHEALYPGMPTSALRHVAVDHVCSARAMGGLLARLVAEPRPPAVMASEQMKLEAMIPALEVDDTAGRLGRASPLTCPDCHGTVFEIDDKGLIRFRCHTGHAFTAETMRAAQGEAVERTLYSALRAQEEQALLAERLAEGARHGGNERGAEALRRRALNYQEGAMTLRRLLAVGSDELP